MAIDSSGSAYVTGATRSLDFPTLDPLQGALAFGRGGASDAFVIKLDANGSSLVYSTYLGGSDIVGDAGLGIAVDSLGNAYVAGATPSTDFPTNNPFQGSKACTAYGCFNAFVAKISSQMTQQPKAEAGPDRQAECTSSEGGIVLLDGSASSDPNSTPGTNDDIVRFEWFKEFGSPSQVFLGTGVQLQVTFPIGTHGVTLRVTDQAGETDTDQVVITVLDTTPPNLTLAVSPAVLWPPNHRMVAAEVAWQVADLCDPSAAARLMTATSSEPDDMVGDGDGRTTGDIAGADIGTPDGEVLLRAERSGTGSGRVYELTYSAVDASGNSASAVTTVTVPHDLGGGPDPLLMGVEPNGLPGMAHLYWSSAVGALGYDLISGDLAALKMESGRVSLGAVSVPARMTTTTSWSEAAGDPVPEGGRAFFYLVQYRDSCGASGFGTESVPLPREPTSCDGVCPGEVTTTSVASSRPLRR